MTVRLAISMGDPAGIGPEVIVKALDELGAEPELSYQVYGPKALFAKAAASCGRPLPQAGMRWIAPAGGAAGLDAALPESAGRLQIESLEAALSAVLTGEADALCTAPITKAAARRAGFGFPGHTEYLAARCGSPQVAMMLAGPLLRVVPLTGHVALREVADLLQPELVAEKVVVTARGLQQDLGLPRPRLALAALNPHAGEEGLMGDEEERLLRPAVELARARLLSQGIAAELSGPAPADALFANYQRYDAIVCCYHDQGLIPLKLLHRDVGVNITLGLPIVRTSPAHGSALDIAGRGIARCESMQAALVAAADIVRTRRQRSTLLP